MNKVFFLILLVSWTAYSLNLRPIVGILSQKPSASMIAGDEDQNYTSYIAASYVKFMESAGARVTPIWINQDRSYYEEIAASVNGIIFPGGSSSIHNDSGYGMAGQILYEQILSRNAQGYYLPLWATCLGFEMLMYLSSNYVDMLVGCDAENIAVPLIPQEGYMDSLLFSEMPPDIFNILTTQNVTANFHSYCYTKEDLVANGLGEDYNLLTTNFDLNNLEFVSTAEHKTLPIFGSQWHPEKNAYEWKNTASYDSIPHFADAIYGVQYLADFFVSQTRLNDQHFISQEEEDSHLIYGYSPKYTGNTTSSFIQVYLFKE